MLSGRYYHALEATHGTPIAANSGEYFLDDGRRCTDEVTVTGLIRELST